MKAFHCRTLVGSRRIRQWSGTLPGFNVHRFSFSSSPPIDDSNTSKESVPLPEQCAVVQGPSLVQTSVARPNPSLLHLPGLRSLPFWTQWDGTINRIAYQDASVTHAVQHLQQHWTTILQEYQTVAPQLASDYQVGATEHSLHQGHWDWHSYMLQGKVQEVFRSHFSATASLLQELRNDHLLFEGTPFGYAFFSTLHPHSRIAAHTAPTNFRLRIHLPLIVPTVVPSSNDIDTPACAIQVGPLVREWIPGQALVLDDAYVHAVWNTTPEKRVLLLVDIWHPDVTRSERADLVQLFAHARHQGWVR
jgi:hypothetical protein